jgi:hypothetical protein
MTTYIHNLNLKRTKFKAVAPADGCIDSRDLTMLLGWAIDLDVVA